MKMYFAEQGHDWGCIIDSNPNMSTFALYDAAAICAECARMAMEIVINHEIKSPRNPKNSTIS